MSTPPNERAEILFYEALKRETGARALFLEEVCGSDRALRDEMEPDPASQLYIPPQRIDELSEPFGNSVHQTRSGL
jgi:hypothetical protein